MLKFKLEITTCPTCGGDKIKRIKRDLKRTFNGVDYNVPALEFYECPDCGEKLFDREAMQKIEAHSPAYKKTARKKAA